LVVEFKKEGKHDIFIKKKLLNKWFNGNFSGLSAFAILKGDKSFIKEI
jgi:hypothetical protein